MAGTLGSVCSNRLKSSDGVDASAMDGGNGEMDARRLSTSSNCNTTRSEHSIFKRRFSNEIPGGSVPVFFCSTNISKRSLPVNDFNLAVKSVCAVLICSE